MVILLPLCEHAMSISINKIRFERAGHIISNQKFLGHLWLWNFLPSYKGRAVIYRRISTFWKTADTFGSQWKLRACNRTAARPQTDIQGVILPKTTRSIIDFVKNKNCGGCWPFNETGKLWQLWENLWE